MIDWRKRTSFLSRRNLHFHSITSFVFQWHKKFPTKIHPSINPSTYKMQVMLLLALRFLVQLTMLFHMDSNLLILVVCDCGTCNENVAASAYLKSWSKSGHLMAVHLSTASKSSEIFSSGSDNRHCLAGKLGKTKS